MPIVALYREPQIDAQKLSDEKSGGQGDPLVNVQAKIDAILDKISKAGYESLSKQEKDYLFTHGKDV